MHKYFYTKYYFINSLDTNFTKNLDNNTTIIYRNYAKDVLDEELILKFKYTCKKLNIKFILSNNFKLSLKLNLNGAYIPSFNKSFEHLSYSYPKNFLILGSAHNIKEIKIKESQKVDLIFISSLFKKNKNFLGTNKFKLLNNFTKKKIIALGGISKKNIKKLKLLGCNGFAGISYFKEKKGP